MGKRRTILPALKALLLPLLLILVLLFFFTALNNLENSRDSKGREQLELSLRRSVAACYAAEGIYPPDVEYMEERYGLQIDKERFKVFYLPVADNLMPDITVLEIGT